MHSHSIAILIAAILLIGFGSLLALGASCNCDDTCGSLLGCFKDGHGSCTQVWSHRCQNNACGGWFPWQSDCAYGCQWINYWCPIGDDCEVVTSYYEHCVG
jgi:hypothetical protein